jgi:hypothetical protein
VKRQLVLDVPLRIQADELPEPAPRPHLAPDFSGAGASSAVNTAVA